MHIHTHNSGITIRGKGEGCAFEREVEGSWAKRKWEEEKINLKKF